MDLGLKGLTAVIAASSKGLGFATARQLVLEGANVVINGRDEAALAEAEVRLNELGMEKVLAVAGDISDKEMPARLVSAAVEHFGQLDIVVTNSGGPAAGKFEDLTEEQWAKAVDLSLLSHVRLIKAALPYLKQSTAPSVLTVTSVSVKQPIPGLLLSNSVRAATIGLTKTLALELGSTGIRFNSILPGWTETERVSYLLGARAKQNGTTVEEEYWKQVGDTPLGRMATAEEFGNVAAFLVSPAASYVTGVMLAVDGGAYQGTL